MSLKHQSLHIKATTILDPSGNAIMLVGRGGAGKSTLAANLNAFGYETLSNTHTIYKDGMVWGVNTWVRTRKNGSQHYLSPNPPTSKGVAKLTKLIIYEKRDDNDFVEITLSENQVINFFIQFGLATCNYDLKEDLSDSFGADVEYLRRAELEYALTQKMLNTISLSYLSANIFNPSHLEKILISIGR